MSGADSAVPTGLPFLLLDFFAAHIIPEATWFILPIEAILGRKTIYFAEVGARKRQDLHAEYREAWHLLRER